MRQLSVSVAMCTWNGEQFLEEQLRSISSQTRLPSELIISDDASTDGTRELIHDFIRSAPFPVRLSLNEQRVGVQRNFEVAINMCKGDIIFPADQDDVWLPHKVARLSGPFEHAQDVGLVFCDLYVVSESLQPFGYTLCRAVGYSRAMQRELARGWAFQALMKHNVVVGAAMAFRASLTNHLLPIGGGWMHDEWIALIASAMSDVVPIHEPLVNYRLHKGQSIGARKLNLVDQFRYAREQMNVDYFKRMVERSSAAHDRLLALHANLRDPVYIQLMQARFAHSQARLRLRVRHARRLPTVLKELIRGNYGLFGYGWRSVAQDLFL